MNTIAKLIFPASIMLLSLGAAQAGPPGPPPFAYFDLDGDGKITEQEFNTARAQRMEERARQGYLLRNAGRHPPFGQLDRDEDGYLTPQEMYAARAARWEQMRRYQGAAQPWPPCPGPRY
jgi:hypothetical protein